MSEIILYTMAPCPNGCFSARIYTQDFDSGETIYYAACDCGWEGPHASSEVQATIAWNKRK
jgi:hypothetical protein